MKLFVRIRAVARFRWMLLFVVLVVPQLSKAQWQATVGAQSPDKGRQILAFLPNEIWVHAGDSVTWKVQTDETHTVTFLVSGELRPPFTAGCPGATRDDSDFDDSSCVNGGPQVKGQSFTVRFPAAGNFRLVCLVHVNMTGVVHVLDPAEPLPHDQDFYDEQAWDQQRDLLDQSRFAKRRIAAFSSGDRDYPPRRTDCAAQTPWTGRDCAGRNGVGSCVARR